MKLDEAKSSVCSYIDNISNELIAISHAIHENPELGYEEHFAHEQLTQVLIEKGLNVSKGAYELDTAFEATAGKAGPVVAYCVNMTLCLGSDMRVVTILSQRQGSEPVWQPRLWRKLLTEDYEFLARQLRKVVVAKSEC